MKYYTTQPHSCLLWHIRYKLIMYLLSRMSRWWVHVWPAFVIFVSCWIMAAKCDTGTKRQYLSDFKHAKKFIICFFFGITPTSNEMEFELPTFLMLTMMLNVILVVNNCKPRSEMYARLLIKPLEELMFEKYGIETINEAR